MRLILIEDNPRLADSIQRSMLADGFAVDWYDTLAAAREALNIAGYDLILLDLGMPDGDGIDFLARLRACGVTTPVLVITARDALGDRVKGLDTGADDYLIKPFATAELSARCRALLRRPGGVLGTILECGNVSLDSAARRVTVGGKAIEMPPRELSLLEQLLRNAGRVVTKVAIDASLYALHSDVTPNAIDAALSRLRKRLSSASANVMIHTAHGIGYMLAPAPGSPAPAEPRDA